MTNLVNKICRLLLIAVLAVVAFPGNIPGGTPVPISSPEASTVQSPDKESHAQLQEIIFATTSFLPCPETSLFNGLVSINYRFPALVALFKVNIPGITVPKKIFYHFVDINGP